MTPVYRRERRERGLFYRRLEVPGLERFEGVSVHYAATQAEAQPFVRSDSIKRVASAVGEGAMAVRLVHQYLADTVV